MGEAERVCWHAWGVAVGCDGALVEGGKDGLRGFEAGGFPEDVEHEGLVGAVFCLAFGLVEELL